jgi:hypothetical protein
MRQSVVQSVQAESSRAGGSGLVDASRLALRDDVGDHEMGIIERVYIAYVVGLRTLCQGIARIVHVLHALRVVPLDRSRDDAAQEDAGVRVPTGVATGAVNDIAPSLLHRAPAGIGVELAHRGRSFCGGLSQILLK